MDKPKIIWIQPPLPFEPHEVYNLGVPPSAGHSETEFLHAALDLLAILVDWLAEVHPDIIAEFDATHTILFAEGSGD
jgi:hypothetical protein